MRIPIHVGLGVRFKLENVNPITGKRTPLSGWSPNVMLTSGMNIMADRGDWFDWCQVGTSNVTPNAAQTALVEWVAGTDNILAGSITSGAQATPPYYGWMQKVWRFLPGEIPITSGLNEVCIGWGSGAAAANESTNRARIVDINGDFTTPTPDPDEYLDITAELRYYPPLGTSTGSVDFNGETFSYELIAAEVTSTEDWGGRIGQAMGKYSTVDSDWLAYNGDIGTIDTTPSGLTANCDNSSQFNSAYSQLSNTIGMNSNCGAAGWNIGAGDLRSLRIKTTAGNYQIEFRRTSPADDASVPKTTSFTMFVKFDLTWAQGTIP